MFTLERCQEEMDVKLRCFSHLLHFRRIVLLLHQSDCGSEHIWVSAFRQSYISSVTVVSEPVLCRFLDKTLHGEKYIISDGAVIWEVFEYSSDLNLEVRHFFAVDNLTDCLIHSTKFICE